MVLAVQWVSGPCCRRICCLWSELQPQVLCQWLHHAPMQLEAHSRQPGPPLTAYPVGTGEHHAATTVGQAQSVAHWLSAAPPTERQSSHSSNHASTTRTERHISNGVCELGTCALCETPLTARMNASSCCPVCEHTRCNTLCPLLDRAHASVSTHAPCAGSTFCTGDHAGECTRAQGAMAWAPPMEAGIPGCRKQNACLPRAARP